MVIMAPGYERRTFTEKIASNDPDVIEYKPIELRAVLAMR
jgi:hypothetical protein